MAHVIQSTDAGSCDVFALCRFHRCRRRHAGAADAEAGRVFPRSNGGPPAGEPVVPVDSEHDEIQHRVRALGGGGASSIPSSKAPPVSNYDF